MVQRRNLFSETDLSLLIPNAPSVPRDTPLMPGIRTLIDEGRLSDPVVVLAQAVLENPAIDCRHGNPAAKSSVSVELTEYLEYLLCVGALSLADEILLMSLHRELHDLGSSKRYSIFNKDIVLHWTQKSLAMLEKVDPDDVALADMFIWTVFKIGGTMVTPFLNMASNDPRDLRFQLMVSAMDRFWQIRDGKSLRVSLSRFNPTEEYIYWWCLIWEMVKDEYENPNSLSQMQLRNRSTVS